MSDSSNSRQLYARLLVYVKPYWLAFAGALAAMAVSSAIEPLFPAMMKYLLDDGFNKARGGWDFLIYPVGIFLIFLSRAFFGFLADYAMSWVSQNVITELRRLMFERLLELPTSYLYDNSSGRLLSRVSNDVSGVANAATSALTVMVKDSISLVGLLIWLLILNWKLTLITLAMFPFIAIVVAAFSKRLRHVSRGLQESQGQITQILQEAIEGHKVVRIFGGQTYESQRFDKASQKQRSLNLRNTVASALMGPIVQFFAALALAIIMGVALYQASNNQATVGGFVSFITAMLMLLAPLKRITDVNGTIQKGLAAAESVFHILDTKPEVNQGQSKLLPAKGSIRFENVLFSYPGADRKALNRLSFSVDPGECVALVGPSGSGKTTIANLLPRLYDINDGHIKIDGIDIRDIELKNLRSNIALVSQDVVLFNDTIAANIAYGTMHAANVDAIRAAADAAGATEFIDPLPNGFNTFIGENGVKLSGGQRQRLAIARALLKNAPILILDEATSALDTESERTVQAALERLMKGRTTIVIAHRLSTIENADRIITLASGTKQEEGTHAELLTNNGLYARLHNMQQLMEE